MKQLVLAATVAAPAVAGPDKGTRKAYSLTDARVRRHPRPAGRRRSHDRARVDDEAAQAVRPDRRRPEAGLPAARAPRRPQLRGARAVGLVGVASANAPAEAVVAS